MGAIKDIVDLCIKLRDEVGDRKAGEVVGKIQSLTLALQSEQVTIVEKNSELVTENLGLKRKLSDLETAHAQAITALQEKHRNEIAKIAASNPKPKDDLDPKTKGILIYFFKQAREVSEREIAQRFQLELSVASYHLDVLWKKKLIGSGGIVVIGGFGDDFADNSSKYDITIEGRKYVMENGCD